MGLQGFQAQDRTLATWFNLIRGGSIKLPVSSDTPHGIKKLLSACSRRSCGNCQRGSLWCSTSAAKNLSSHAT